MVLTYIKTDGTRSTIRVSNTQKEVIEYLCKDFANIYNSTNDYLTNLYNIYSKIGYETTFSAYVRDILFNVCLKLLQNSNNNSILKRKD